MMKIDPLIVDVVEGCVKTGHRLSASLQLEEVIETFRFDYEYDYEYEFSPLRLVRMCKTVTLSRQLENLVVVVSTTTRFLAKLV